ncbi:MAG: class II fructose-bisphosphate aldolase [Anaerolineae bacterium]
MTLCDLRPWLDRAQREKFAIGAFNANTLEQVQAIVIAAQAEQSPAVIQVSHRALQYLGSGAELLGLEYIAAVGRVAAQSVAVPIALHLDHATEDEVRRAISLGFTSVMFDGSLLPYDQNVQMTRRLADEARIAGVCMEAELGEVPKPGVSEDTGALTDPDEAAAFVARNRDRFAGDCARLNARCRRQARLHRSRTPEGDRAAVSLPLVLHGSSSVLDGQIAEGIRLGLCKVNVATQLNKVFTLAARARLEDDEAIVDRAKIISVRRAGGDRRRARAHPVLRLVRQGGVRDPLRQR